MAEMSIRDFLKQADEAEESSSNLPRAPEGRPSQGEKVTVEIEGVNYNEQDNGGMRWGVLCKVVTPESDIAGTGFWANLAFNPTWPFITKKAIEGMVALGVTEAFLGTNPSGEEIAAALKGKKAVVVGGWRKSKKNGKVYEDFTFVSLRREAPTAPSPVPEYDADYDDEEPF